MEEGCASSGGVLAEDDEEGYGVEPKKLNCRHCHVQPGNVTVTPVVQLSALVSAVMRRRGNERLGLPWRLLTVRRPLSV